jgi:NADH:ubiquinone oxidoreductase subunit 6 (subunit J)
VGIYTEVSDGLRLLGWEVFTTYYVPDLTLLALAALALLLTIIGFSTLTTRK